jgi:hypothetical protein
MRQKLLDRSIRAFAGTRLVAKLELGRSGARCLLARINPGIAFHLLREERVHACMAAGPGGVLWGVPAFRSRGSGRLASPRWPAFRWAPPSPGCTPLTIRDRRTCLHALRLRRPDVAALRQRLQALPVQRRRRLQGLESERVEIILAAAVVIEQLTDLGGYPTLTVCTREVRHGLLMAETFGGAAPS